MRLKEKTVIITGGGRGLGFATVELFITEGARVAVWDVAPASDHLKSILSANGGVFHRGDVSSLVDVERMAADTARHFEHIDILINNAGITRDATLMKMTPEQWSEVIGVNLNGVFFCAQTVAAGMAARGSGNIINTTSIVGRDGNFGQTNYVAAKAGVIGMTKTWARELGPKGIRVNAVAPGFIDTEMARQVPAQLLENIRGRTPLRRFGAPRDVAQAYLFLASDESAFISGTVLSVDGGLVL